MRLRGRGRLARHAAAWAVGTALALGLPRPGGAQGVPFVRTVAQPVDSCPAVGPVVVDDDARRDARRLRDEAASSQLAGDPAGARDRLRRAARLDPSDPDLAYRLARAHEEMNDARGARAEYCRFRALARSPQDVAEAEERLAALGAARPDSAALDPAAVRFRAGVARVEAGDLAGAELEFTAALDRWPHHSPSLLDRAAVRTALGRVAPALEDLERYVAAVPAPVTGALAARDALRAGTREPATVMAAGLLPGGAQFATGRPVAGTLVAALTIAGVALAVQSRTVEREQRFTDPFGNPYTERVPVVEHPRRLLGVSIGLAAIAGGALEGFFHARSGRRDAERLQRDTRAALSGSLAREDSTR